MTKYIYDDIQKGVSTVKLPSNVGTMHRITNHIWKMAFIFAFISLVIDGIDIMLLSFSLTRLKAAFGLGSFTIAFIMMSAAYLLLVLFPDYLLKNANMTHNKQLFDLKQKYKHQLNCKIGLPKF